MSTAIRFLLPQPLNKGTAVASWKGYTLRALAYRNAAQARTCRLRNNSDSNKSNNQKATAIETEVTTVVKATGPQSAIAIATKMTSRVLVVVVVVVVAAAAAAAAVVIVVVVVRARARDRVRVS